MPDTRAQELLKQGNELFDKRATLLSLWQEIASNFYIERADFTLQRVIGTTFAESLMTSYPIMARRQLGDAFSAMLRPTQKAWFKVTISREDKLDDAGRRWLAYATEVQRRAMYGRATNFHRATKEADHDFAAFGQAVISTEMNRKRDDLLFRNWHLRDVAWSENVEGKIDTIHRKWKLAASAAVKMFPKTVSKSTEETAKKKPYEPVDLRHVIIPADEYDTASGGVVAENGQGGGRRKWRTPYVSIYFEEKGDILEETGSWTPIYIIPRWQTVSGSQYAYSPATVAALPDARLIQAITLTLLEAGEKFTSPPLLAVQEAIRGDLQVYAGGVTWVDPEYDERLGEVLRPLTQDKSGMPLGRDIRNDVREAIAEAFYLNKLSMPMGASDGKQTEMTAFEVGQRIQEYIRNALPLFEPMEIDYNGNLCDQTFDVLMRNGAFVGAGPLPQSLHGAEIQFRFESPLSDAIEAQKAGKLVQTKQLLAQVVDLDPTTAQLLDAKTALRDALLGIGDPPSWLRSPEQMEQIAQAAAEKQQAEQVMAGMERASGIVKNLSGAMPQGGAAQPDQSAAQ